MPRSKAAPTRGRRRLYAATTPASRSCRSRSGAATRCRRCARRPRCCSCCGSRDNGFAPDMLFPLAALAVSYGALNRLSHCSFNRTFPRLRELATWHPLPGWNGARPPILKLSMWLGRTINVYRSPLGCVSECITDRQQQRASSTVGSLGPLLTIRGLLIGKARLYQSADDFNLSFRSGVCDYTSDAGQCCAKWGAPLFHGR